MKLSKKRRQLEIEEYRKAKELMKPIYGANFIFMICFLSGLVCILFGILIYLNTFISSYLLSSIVLIIGLIGYPISRKIILFLYKKPYSFLYTYLLSVIFFGGLCYYGFLKVNFHFANKNSEYKSLLSIEDLGELGGKNHSPYVVVRHKDKEKWVVFNSNTYIDNPKFLELYIRNGFFNFEVIKSKKLK